MCCLQYIAECKRIWKSTPLRTGFLCFIIVVSTGLLATIERLRSKSQKQRGIIFAADINNLPLSQSFGYLYLPTILAVIYGILWSWIDLEAKRLEPYRQLSKPGGASAEDSILLDYPFDFLASVPLHSARRR
jgi:hypothetical protein